MPESIAIIGGGLSGLVCAIALSQRKLGCTVYERGHEDTIGGAISIEPNGMAVLDHLGILTAVSCTGVEYDGTSVYSVDGKLLTRTTRSATHKSARFERPKLHSTVLRLAQQSGVIVNFDHRLVAINPERDFLTLSFADGISTTAKFLIAADGLHSTARRSFLPHVKPMYENITAFGGAAQVSKLRWPDGGSRDTPMVQFDPHGSVMGVSRTDPHDQDRIAVFVNVQLQEDEALKARKCADQSVKECLASQKDPLKSLAHSITNPMVWPFYVLPELPSWRFCDDRVVLVGDAAHTISPRTGNGAAQAFEDAELLARTLAEGHTLTAWEEERRRRIQLVCDVKLRHVGGEALMEKLLQYDGRSVIYS